MTYLHLIQKTTMKVVVILNSIKHIIHALGDRSISDVFRISQILQTFKAKLNQVKINN